MMFSTKCPVALGPDGLDVRALENFVLGSPALLQLVREARGDARGLAPRT